MTGRVPRHGGSIKVSADVREFLEAAAEYAGTDIAAILTATLGVRPLTEYPEAGPFLSRIDADARATLEELDRMLRVANPGSQIAFRQVYIGYRRDDPRRSSGPLASRSQVYASLLPRQTFVRLILPLDPVDYQHVDGIEDLRGKGRHGVGDLSINVHSPEQAREVMRIFDTWLGPLRG